MTRNQRWECCLRLAAAIVSQRRAEAPEGCDPQNTWAAIAVGVGGAAIGGGLALGASNKASAPPPRDLSGELGGIGANYPAYLQMQKDLADYQVNTLYPEMAAQERQATTQQRRGDYFDLTRFGPRYEQTLQGLSPSWTNALAGINKQITAGNQPDALALRTNAEALAAGPSAIRTALDTQAQNELALGGSLSPEQIRDAQQASRQAYSDRGLSGGNADIVSEAMNRDAYSRALLAQQLQFASGVAGLDLSENAQNRNFQTSVENQNQAQLQNWRSFLGSGAQIGQNSLQPILGFFGQRTDVSPTAPAGILGSSASAVSSVTNPLLNYGSDVYGTNYNAQAAANIANFNQRAALSGGLMNMGGKILGA